MSENIHTCSVSLTVQVSTEDRRSYLVDGFVGREAMSQLYEFEVQLRNTAAVATADLVGKPAVLWITTNTIPEDNLTPDFTLDADEVTPLARNDETNRYVHGLIAAVEQRGVDQLHVDQGSPELHHLYTVTLVPDVWKLQQRSDCRIFQPASAATTWGVQQVVESVMQDLGFQSSFFDASAPEGSDRLEYVVQYRESDWNFIGRLLEQEGYFYFFDHGIKNHVLRIGRASGNHTTIPGSSGSVTHGADDGESIDQFVLRQSLRPSQLTLQDYDPAAPRTPQQVTLGEESSSRCPLRLYDFPDLANQTRGYQALAQRWLEEARVPGMQGAGRGNCLRLLPGYLFTLAPPVVEGASSADSDDQDEVSDGLYRQYLVTAVEHLFQRTTGSASSPQGQYDNSFRCIPGDLQFRPPRVTPRPSVQGLQTATVVGPTGGEVYTETDKPGRVKLRFHWDRAEMADESTRSCWVRVSQFMASAGHGASWIPRVGDEVIVDFIEGDPGQPIVTGRVYNLLNPLPEGQDAQEPATNVISARDRIVMRSDEQNIHVESPTTVSVDAGQYIEGVAGDAATVTVKDRETESSLGVALAALDSAIDDKKQTIDSSSYENLESQRDLRADEIKAKKTAILQKQAERITEELADGDLSSIDTELATLQGQLQDLQDNDSTDLTQRGLQQLEQDIASAKSAAGADTIEAEIAEAEAKKQAIMDQLKVARVELHNSAGSGTVSVHSNQVISQQAGESISSSTPGLISQRADQLISLNSGGQISQDAQDSISLCTPGQISQQADQLISLSSDGQIEHSAKQQLSLRSDQATTLFANDQLTVEVNQGASSPLLALKLQSQDAGDQQGELDALDGQMRHLQEQLDAATDDEYKQLQAERDRRASQIQEKDTELQQKRSDLSMLGMEKDSKEDEKAEEEDKGDAKDATLIAELQARITEIEGEEDTLEGQISTLDSEIATLKDNTAASIPDKGLKQLDEELQTKREQLGLDDLEAQMAELAQQAQEKLASLCKASIELSMEGDTAKITLRTAGNISIDAGEEANIDINGGTVNVNCD